MGGVCWCSMTSVKLSADSVDEEKKSLVKAGNDSFWKWSWLTSPSIHGDLKKSHRCFLKESSILSKRIVGAKRENRRFFLKASSVLMGSKSIYSPKSLNCYVSGGNNTWQKHSKMALMYSSNSIGWMTSAFSRAICLPSGSCHADRADSPMVCLCMWLQKSPNLWYPNHLKESSDQLQTDRWHCGWFVQPPEDTERTLGTQTD